MEQRRGQVLRIVPVAAPRVGVSESKVVSEKRPGGGHSTRTVYHRNPYKDTVNVRASKAPIAAKCAAIVRADTGLDAQQSAYAIAHWGAFEADGNEKDVTYSPDLGWEAGLYNISRSEAERRKLTRADCLDPEIATKKYLVPMIGQVARALVQNDLGHNDQEGFTHGVLFLCKLQHGLGHWHHLMPLLKDSQFAKSTPAVRIIATARDWAARSHSMRNRLHVAVSGWCVGAPQWLAFGE